ncbi:MAG: hypothetical protein GXZ18_02175 [Synergistaceae bacterium]|nr:hypothetical protein [Synergistaceae bacterium]
MNFTQYIDFRRFFRKASFVVFVLFIIFAPCMANANVRVEEEVGKLLVKEFDPESLLVQATNGGSFLYAKAKGVVLEGLRIDSISVFAMMKEPPKDLTGKDAYGLADLIYLSRAEVVLLKKDVDDYTTTAIEDVKGFTDLKVDFSTDKLSVSGTYTAKFLFTFNIRLLAKSRLGFINGDLSLVDTEFYISGVRQPEYLTNKLLEEINPLIKRSKIPFPININNIIMTKDKIVVTGKPKPLEGDALCTWRYAKD